MRERKIRGKLNKKYSEFWLYQLKEVILKINLKKISFKENLNVCSLKQADAHNTALLSFFLINSLNHKK